MFAQASQLNNAQRDTSVASRTELQPETDVADVGAITKRQMLRRPSQMPLRRKLDGNTGSTTAPALVHDVVRSAGRPLEPQTRLTMEQGFGEDFSQVRIHTDGKAAESARAISAQAYTTGRHIAFGTGSYAPSTEKGKHLPAHELAHTLQQSEGSEAVRRRRVPDQANLDGILDPSGPDRAQHETGLLRLLRTAWDELNKDQKKTVTQAAAQFGISGATTALMFEQLSIGTTDQIKQFAQLVRAANTDLVLLDPALINTGARPGTADDANINSLVSGADVVFDKIKAKTQDTDLTNIFGHNNIEIARKKFAKGQDAMHKLQAANKIVTDRSKYTDEILMDGLKSKGTILLAHEIIDNPLVNAHIAVLIHESMHAGNRDVGDSGYVDKSSFPNMKEKDKLNNAADYEVVAIRILDKNDPEGFPGVPFTPFGAINHGVTNPTSTQIQTAISEANQTFTSAWTTALRLHTFYVRVFKNPTEWKTLDLSREYGVRGHFADCLPYWSKVEKMTIHERSGIKPAAGVPATAPVTEIDIAQSEGVTRKLSMGVEETTRQVLTEPKALDLENKYPSLTHQADISKGAAHETKLLVSLILIDKIGEITGSPSRDERVIARLVKAYDAQYSVMDELNPKHPSSFPD